jgi:alkylation response protein AidB-like acyl-CoA dehydrogenase
MDFDFTDAQQAFRRDVRSWLAEHVPADLRGRGFAASRGEREHVTRLRAWQRRLHGAGYVGMDWPTEYGGRGASIVEQIIFYEEMSRAEAPQPLNRSGLSMLGPTIMRHGTPAQRERHLAKILTAEEIWCQGFSEPNAGSDLANLQTRAVLDGDHYVINGQKVWTSMAHVAEWGFFLVRTDASGAKHKGITFILVDMKTPGISIRPLRQITGEAEFNEVFLENVRVPASNVVGKVNEGWGVALTTLAYERDVLTMIRHISLRTALERLIARAKQTKRNGHTAAQDPVLRQKLASLTIAERCLQLNWIPEPHPDPQGHAARARRLDVEALLESGGPGAGRGRYRGHRPVLADRGRQRVGARRGPVAVLHAPGARQRHPRGGPRRSCAISSASACSVCPRD